jgi:hypothetical protein
MYIVRFSYDFLPLHRQQVIALIQREVEGARAQGLQARLLVPLTRAPGGPSLYYEIELDRHVAPDVAGYADAVNRAS